MPQTCHHAQQVVFHASQIQIVKNMQYMHLSRTKRCRKANKRFAKHVPTLFFSLSWWPVYTECKRIDLFDLNACWSPHLKISPVHFSWQVANSVIFCFWTDPLLSSHMRLWMSDGSFTQCILKIHQSGYSAVSLLHGHMKLLPFWCMFCGHHTAMHQFACHFTSSRIRREHACWAVACHLHFWQNDWDLLHATVVTRGWSRYKNKSQHRKLTLEKKILHIYTYIPLRL